MKVPDFESIKDDMEQQDNFISERFREFAQLERNIEPSPDKEEAPEIPNILDLGLESSSKGESSHQVTQDSSQQVTQDSSHQVTRPNHLSSFARHGGNNNSDASWSKVSTPTLPPPPANLEDYRVGSSHQMVDSSQNQITPQKQFMLLAQSLRHPDGSSNPELNVIDMKKRSPGMNCIKIGLPGKLGFNSHGQKTA